ncbi:hypothetical protein RD792_012418 [Penstemon davidsonii]|uniref:RING-type E3 ubiquitin transferase n=1 Tax=Penstemon davidsonii TaxID=160366 RepID=A0ABR0CX71_9LAMI|nr:hypothetical protein RD792_012418 [Penstemon davidsonii]
MQGRRSSLSTLPENLSFDHGSTSSDTDIDSQIPWNTMQTSALNRVPDFRIPSNEINTQYIHHRVSNEGQNVNWSLGQASSSTSQNLGDQNERKAEHTWINFHSQAPHTWEERHYESSNIYSFDNAEVNPNENLTTNGSFLLPSSSSSYILPQDLNISSEEDDCQIVERPLNEQMTSGGSSGIPRFNEDDRRMSRKRKALVGPSSETGSSNSSRSQWRQNGNELVINNGSEPENPRLRLGVGRPVSPSPFSITPSGNTESSRRNLRLRVNGLHQQDPIAINPFPAPSIENGIPHVNYVPSMVRTPPTRWSGASSSRTIRGESTARNIPRSISEHPVFVPPTEIGTSSSQNPINWHLSDGNNNIAGHVGSSSRVGSGSGVDSLAPTWAHRSRPQYPRRLTEIVRRSLVSSAGTESGGPIGNNAIPQEMAISSGPVNHTLSSRAALWERHIDGALGIPHPMRTLASSSVGRSSMMSEIRHVLDLMRRGEALRLEDMMILDHSVFVGMSDIHDRHRDMRLDVDNMSYEELLALEERIGNVCTGLTEESIMSRLKQRKYVVSRAEDQAETEPCSICREEYNGGEDLGTLECGHDFHKDCIKQWLMQKNLCPICKTTGLTT